MELWTKPLCYHDVKLVAILTKPQPLAIRPPIPGRRNEGLRRYRRRHESQSRLHCVCTTIRQQEQQQEGQQQEEGGRANNNQRGQRRSKLETLLELQQSHVFIWVPTQTSESATYSECPQPAEEGYARAGSDERHRKLGRTTLKTPVSIHEYL